MSSDQAVSSANPNPSETREGGNEPLRQAGNSEPGSVRSVVVKGVVVLGLLGVTIVAMFTINPETGVSEAAVRMELPDTLGVYRGEDQEVSESERAILPKDTQFAKKLYTGNGSQILCQIVLAGAEKRSIHRPEICLPGQGWSLKSGQVVPVRLPNGSTLEVMELRLGRPVMTSDGSQRELTSLFYYWFVGKGSTTPHHLTRILKTNLDMLLHNINHRWAYIIVSSPVWAGLRPDGKTEEETRAELTKFISEIAPLIMLDYESPKEA